MNKEAEDTYKKIYSSGWGNRWPSEPMITYYHNIIKKNIEKKESIFEFASGTGSNLRFFKELGFECFGIDTATQAIKVGIDSWELKPENFSDKNVFEKETISEVFNKRKFDIVMCLHTMSYFSDDEMDKLLRQFKDVMYKNSVLYVNLHSVNRADNIKKLPSGMYELTKSGSITEVTYLNLVASKEECEAKFTKYFDTIAIRTTTKESDCGIDEMFHYFGKVK